MSATWSVLFHDEFDGEFESLPEAVQDELLAHALLLRQFGPALGRPTVDTLKGSCHTNMKELRFNVGKQVWRTALAFDPKRRAVLLVAGNKAGVNQKRFYSRLITVADKRYSTHIAKLSK